MTRLKWAGAEKCTGKAERVAQVVERGTTLLQPSGKTMISEGDDRLRERTVELDVESVSKHQHTHDGRMFHTFPPRRDHGRLSSHRLLGTRC